MAVPHEYFGLTGRRSGPGPVFNPCCDTAIPMKTNNRAARQPAVTVRCRPLLRLMRSSSVELGQCESFLKSPLAYTCSISERMLRTAKSCYGAKPKNPSTRKNDPRTENYSPSRLL